MRGKGSAAIRRPLFRAFHTLEANDNRADLNLALIKRLKFGERPVGVNAKGALVSEANIENKPYILWDSNRDAPPRFGGRVASKEPYIMSRRHKPS